MAASGTLWPAAASERSAALLDGPARPAVVLAAFPSALYLQVGGHAEVLPIVTPQGLRLPTALAVASALPTVGWGAQPGDEVVVGRGEVRLGGLTIRAVRTWRPQPVVRAAIGGCGDRLATLRLPWRQSAHLLVDVLVARDRTPQNLRCHVATLVGAGPGLTPSGDDVLCGILLGLRLHPLGSQALVDDLWGAVRPRLSTTTSLSAALLREAADGYAVAPVNRLLSVLAEPEPQLEPEPQPERQPEPLPTSRPRATFARGEPSVAVAVREVLAVGHTSGSDLLGGLAGCLDALSVSLPMTGDARNQRSLP